MVGEETHLYSIKNILAEFNVEVACKNQYLTFTAGDKSISYNISLNLPPLNEEFPCFTKDSLIMDPKIISGIILSKLKLNKTIFARTCGVERVDNFQKN